MAEPLADVLTRVADVTGRIGPLLVELLNHPDTAEQAAELDGRVVEPPGRVVIDARVER